MKAQMTHEQQRKPSLSNLTAGNWITVIAGCLFIVSLFLDWTSAPGFLFAIVHKGIAFMKFGRGTASGLPYLYFFTLLAAIGCICLCLPFLKQQNRGNYKVIPIIQIFLSVLGLLPFVLLRLELKTWRPVGQIEIGGRLAIVAAVGLLIGAIVTWTEIRQQ